MMPTNYEVQVMSTVEVTINDPDVIERVTGPNGDEWRDGLYQLHTAQDVLEHLAANAVANGLRDASLLDGWADLPPEAVEMYFTIDHADCGWVA